MPFFKKKGILYKKKPKHSTKDGHFHHYTHKRGVYLHQSKEKTAKKERHPGKRMRKCTIVVIFIYK